MPWNFILDAVACREPRRVWDARKSGLGKTAKLSSRELRAHRICNTPKFPESLLFLEAVPRGTDEPSVWETGDSGWQDQQGGRIAAIVLPCGSRPLDMHTHNHIESKMSPLHWHHQRRLLAFPHPVKNSDGLHLLCAAIILGSGPVHVHSSSQKPLQSPFHRGGYWLREVRKVG